MADLFQKDIRTINEHLQNIYEEGELDPAATIRKFRIVQTEGSRQVERLVDHYHLNAILAVGFRVSSQRGTQFRQWAIARLEEYLRKGFTMECPNCGLLEDVTSQGVLVTYPKDSTDPKDCGLRFRPVGKTSFACPACGTRIKAVIS